MWGCGEEWRGSDPVLGVFLPIIVVNGPHKVGGSCDSREVAKVGTSQ